MREAAILGRADLYFLLTWFCGRRDVAAHDWIYARCREVQAEPDGVLDLWARYHYKSSIITFGQTVRDILREPEVTIGIFSNTKAIAEPFLEQIKREFESNERLKEAYPDVLYANPARDAPQWSAVDGIVVRRRGNPKEATVEAHGLLKGMPTGRHFDIRVYDDAVTKESVTNAEQITATTQAIDLSQNLGTAEGRARYIGTRYHLADSYDAMIQRKMVRTRVHPATDNGRPEGNPVLLTPAQWAKVKRDQPSAYPAQMLQNPAAGKQGMFEVKWLKTWESRPRTLNVYIMGDPSLGKNKRSDRTGIAVIGVDAQGTKYLLDGYRHRMNQPQRWTALKTLHKRWSRAQGVSTVSVGWERYGMQTDLEYFEERMMYDPDKYNFSIEELSWLREGPQSKKARVERLVPDLEQGQLLLPALAWSDGCPVVRWWIHEDKMHQRHLAEMGENQHGVPIVTKYLETATQKRCRAQGIADTLAAPIRRVDEEGNIYDVTMALIEEISFFPFGKHDDLIDAVARVYDMKPSRPMIVREEHVEPRRYVDGT